MADVTNAEDTEEENCRKDLTEKEWARGNVTEYMKRSSSQIHRSQAHGS